MYVKVVTKYGNSEINEHQLCESLWLKLDRPPLRRRLSCRPCAFVATHGQSSARSSKCTVVWKYLKKDTPLVQFADFNLSEGCFPIFSGIFYKFIQFVYDF